MQEGKAKKKNPKYLRKEFALQPSLTSPSKYFSLLFLTTSHEIKFQKFFKD